MVNTAYAAGILQVVFALCTLATSIYFLWSAKPRRFFHAGFLLLLALHFLRLSFRTLEIAQGNSGNNLTAAKPDLILADTVALIVGFVAVFFEARTIHRDRMDRGEYP